MNPENPIFLVSPREPSGVSWIINCLLELGIRVDLQPTVDQIFGAGQAPASAMWLPEPDGRWRLHPRASALQKWLPFLSRAEVFSFRPIPPILHIQRLPLCNERRDQVILFVRDLRDALHSLYRRMQPELSWSEFVDWPNSETLLDAIDHWRLFIESWIDQPNLFIGRFEDYKADARALLAQVLATVQIECSPDEIARATEQSSYTAAASAEARYRETHPHDLAVVNRAGLVGEWESLADLKPTVTEIERRAGQLLTRLGYRTHQEVGAADPWEALSISRGLSSFPHLEIPTRIIDAAPSHSSEKQIERLCGFTQSLTSERLTQSRLEADEIRMLLRHLEEFTSQHAPMLTPSLQTLSHSFADGSAFHLARIRALLLSRRTPSAN